MKGATGALFVLALALGLLTVILALVDDVEATTVIAVGLAGIIAAQLSRE